MVVRRCRHGPAARDGRDHDKVYLSQMRVRLDEAASIAKAAEACADAGNFGKGIEIALDVEQLLYEVTRFSMRPA